jgi:hypothetical protein
LYGTLYNNGWFSSVNHHPALIQGAQFVLGGRLSRTLAVKCVLVKAGRLYSIIYPVKLRDRMQAFLGLGTSNLPYKLCSIMMKI